MNFADDLLEQSLFLAQREKVGSPKQASLRRAVSSAYYALFHLLANAASIACSPANPPGLRFRVQRALEHGNIKEVCNRITKSQDLTSLYASMLSSTASHSYELIEVATTFLELQEARHLADYDLQQRLSRPDVLYLIEKAHHAFIAWETVRDTPETNVFLADLYFGKRWGR